MRPALVAGSRWCASRPTWSLSSSAVVSIAAGVVGPALLTQRMGKGDYGFNVFHNSNPQHGGSYARHERRMSDDELEDFLLSVKGWRPVYEEAELSSEVPEGLTEADMPPRPSTARMGQEAIFRVFKFESFNESYLFMGRVWAFCYGSDKYTDVVWDECRVTVYLYSPSFRGLSKREARLAAFLNDQFNMLRKGRAQSKKITDGVAKTATIEEMLGEAARRSLQAREAARRSPIQEAREGPRRWEDLIKGASSGDLGHAEGESAQKQR